MHAENEETQRDLETKKKKGIGLPGLSDLVENLKRKGETFLALCLCLHLFVQSHGFVYI